MQPLGRRRSPLRRRALLLVLLETCASPGRSCKAIVAGRAPFVTVTVSVAARTQLHKTPYVPNSGPTSEITRCCQADGNPPAHTALIGPRSAHRENGAGRPRATRRSPNRPSCMVGPFALGAADHSSQRATVRHRHPTVAPECTGTSALCPRRLNSKTSERFPPCSFALSFWFVRQPSPPIDGAQSEAAHVPPVDDSVRGLPCLSQQDPVSQHAPTAAVRCALSLIPHFLTPSAWPTRASTHAPASDTGPAIGNSGIARGPARVPIFGESGDAFLSTSSSESGPLLFGTCDVAGR